MGGSVFLAAFLFAASPFPDDVIFIPLGVMRYSPLKIFISLFTGKFVLTLLIGYTARSSAGFLLLVSRGGVLASIVSAIIVILTAVLMMRIEWEDVLLEGRKDALRRLLRSLMRRPVHPKEDPANRTGGSKKNSSG